MDTDGAFANRRRQRRRQHRKLTGRAAAIRALGFLALVGIPGLTSTAWAAGKQSQTPPAPGAAAAPTTAPASAPPARRYAPRGPEPVIKADRSVVFSLSAPGAQDVRLEGLPGAGEMTRGDDGQWTFTTAPLPPEIYEYRFVIDGVHVTDPRNSWAKGSGTSLLDVPVPAGTPPAPWEKTDVPHGDITVAYYTSTALGGIQQRVHIYTPPGYDASKRDSYPTLYLLHGSGDDDSSWADGSRANFIFDNLLAQKLIRPMVVVMPMGMMPRGSGPDVFAADLMNDLLPYVEQHYRVKKDGSQRALAGLSMGGAQTLYTGLNHGDQFAYIGAWSSGWRADGSVPSYLDTNIPAVAKDGSKALPAVKLIYLSGGKSDGLLPMTQGTDAWLTQHGIAHELHVKDGGHQWSLWRASLIEFAPHLFVDSK